MSYLESHVATAAGLNPFSPIAFHEQVARWTLATALNDLVWIRMPGGNRLYPNQYVLLVGRPGIGKSEAYKFSLNHILRPICEELLLPNVTSFEAMIARLSQNGGGTLVYDEFKLFSGQTRDNGYASNVRTALIQLFESGGHLKTEFKKEDGPKTVPPNLALNFLACCTSGTLERNLKDEDFTDGLVSRISIVSKNFRENARCGLSDAEQKDAVHALRQELISVIPRRPTEVTLSRGGLAAFNQVTQEMDSRLEAERDGIIQCLWSRVQVKALKLALLWAIESKVYEISSEFIVSAYDVVSEETSETQRFIESSSRSKGEFGQAMIDLESVLRRAGATGMTKREICRKLGIPKRTIEDILRILSDDGAIEYQEGTRSHAGMGRPTTIIVWSEDAPKAEHYRIELDLQPETELLIEQRSSEGCSVCSVFHREYGATRPFVNPARLELPNGNGVPAVQILTVPFLLRHLDEEKIFRQKGAKT